MQDFEELFIILEECSIFQAQKRLHQRKYFQPMQSSVFSNLEAKHSPYGEKPGRKEPSVGFTSPLQR